MSNNIFIIPQIQYHNQQQQDAIKKCKPIYRPSGAALEYHSLAINPWKGCGFACNYCYVPSVSRMSRVDHDTPPLTLRRPDYLEFLAKGLDKLNKNGLQGSRIFCSFLSDPWNLGGETSYHTGEIIDLIHEKGHYICTLTKSGEGSLISIDKFIAGDQYAASLTCRSESRSQLWEAEAALPESRIEALKVYSSKLGKENIWVSLEPVLYPKDTLDLIRATSKYVGMYKVGKVTANKQAKLVNWHKFTLDVIALAKELDTKIFIKSSLHEYIPCELYGSKLVIKHQNSSEWQPLNRFLPPYDLMRDNFLYPKPNDYINALLEIGNGGILRIVKPTSQGLLTKFHIASANQVPDATEVEAMWAVTGD